MLIEGPLDRELPLPYLHINLRVMDELAEAFRFLEHGVPKGKDGKADVIEVNRANILLQEQLHGDRCSSGEGFNIVIHVTQRRPHLRGHAALTAEPKSLREGGFKCIGPLPYFPFV